MGLTTRLKLLKGVGTDFVKVKDDITDAFDILDDCVGLYTCTAATRPVINLVDGRMIRETDTKNVMRYDLASASWLPVYQGFPAPATAAGNSAATAGGAVEVLDTVLNNYQFTSMGNHNYRAILDNAGITLSVATDIAVVRIRNGGVSAPTIASPIVAGTLGTGGFSAPEGISLSNVFTPVAGLTTLGVSYQRNNGTGTVQVVSPGGASRSLYVMDCGPAS